MAQNAFVGRKRELALLRELRETRSASLVVLRGRRRIGKSRLAEEYGKTFPRTVSLTGIPPAPGVTAAAQRQSFAGQLERVLGRPVPVDRNWGSLLSYLGEHVQRGPNLVILDELSWLGGKDRLFLPELKTAWDLSFKRNSKLVLLLSGSLSAWLEKNVLSSTGFFGRVSLDLFLDELLLPECRHFWPQSGRGIAPFEMLKLLSVTGGVPRYLEEIVPRREAEYNITRMCFRREGLLFAEYQRIFSDLFDKRAPIYERIVRALASGPKSPSDIRSAAHFERGGRFTRTLHDLVSTGYVSEEGGWSFGEGRASRERRYRLSDNYLRFYLKYIEGVRSRIEKGGARALPNWPSVMGLQLENLFLKSTSVAHRMVGLDPSEIVAAGPFVQTATKHRRGCQIDYLVETRFHTLYVFEIKFVQQPVGMEVVRAVEEKVDRLAVPRRFSVRPILVHVNGVTDSVIESEFFSAILDLGVFLSPEEGP